MKNHSNQGVTLVETIVFLVVISIALTALAIVFTESTVTTVNGGAYSKSVVPVMRIRALELGQAQLDEILSRKFDENTPTGGVPACNSTTGAPCLGILPDGEFDDVGDYNGFSYDTAAPVYSVSVAVTEAGTDLGIANSNARLITVTVSMPVSGASPLTLSAYRVNF